MRADFQEYDTELHLTIYVLERHLLCNVDVADSTSTDDPAFITEYGYNED